MRPLDPPDFDHHAAASGTPKPNPEPDVPAEPKDPDRRDRRDRHEGPDEETREDREKQAPGR